MAALESWLTLVLAPGLGPKRINELLVRYGDADAALGAPAAALPASAAEFLRAPDRAAIDRALAWAEAPDCHLLARDDPAYPARLAAIDTPPPLLFVRGRPAVLDDPQLAMVGSRNPTRAGVETARDFARYLAGAGLGITSGLALGIDGAAHQGALDADGTTIAVFGTGLDRVYPARHRDLAHAIVDGGGALVSAFPLGTGPSPGHFPQRNRIIAGLSLGTLVVEAALHSGSLITAREASEQGREVFAIPGSIHSPLARGCHRLIRDGAKLVETAADILEELAPQLRDALRTPPPPASPEEAAAPGAGLDAEQRRLLEHLGHTPTAIDAVVEASGLTPEAVSSMLLLLELEGYVTASPGGRYSRTGKRP